VLCCGDSNVFGLYADAGDTYPSRLQALLDRLEQGERHRVLNLGLPGINSHQVAQGFAHDLDQYRPEVVLLTVGANNVWSTTSAELQHENPAWYEGSRLLRLWRLLRFRLRARELDPQPGGAGVVTRWIDREGREIELSTGTGAQTGVERLREALSADIASMARAARERGVHLILVGYGVDRDMYTAPNAILAELAGSLELPLVETHPYVEGLAAQLGDARVYYPDYHLKGIGYEVVARRVLAELVRAGRVQVASVPSPLDGLGDPALDEPRLRLTGSAGSRQDAADELAFEIRGELPGRRFRILLFSSESPPGARLDFHVLMEDPLVQHTFASGLLSGRLDARGAARVPFGRLLENPAAVRGARLRALYVIQADSDPRLLLRLGDPVELVVP
jgi:lysophospholipase L1-like esterase